MQILNTRQQANRIIDHLEANPHITPIFDLDCVLLDASHRITLKPDGSLDLEHYRANTTRPNVMRDQNLPLMRVVHYLNAIGRDYHVATARVLCEHSQALLQARQIKPVVTISRNGEDDRRKDWDLKTTGIAEHFTPEQYGGLMLLDDCKGNISAFRKLGIMAIEVDYNNTPKQWLQELL